MLDEVARGCDDVSGSSLVDMYHAMQQVTCSFICQWGLGVSSNGSPGPIDTQEFFDQLRRFFYKMEYFTKTPVVAALFLPELNTFFRDLFILSIKTKMIVHPLAIIEKKLISMVKSHDKSLRTSSFESVLDNLMKHLNNNYDGLDVTQIKQGLVEREIIQHCLLLVLAGFETTSATSSFALYELARNAAVQDKLYDEFSTFTAKEGNIFDGRTTHDKAMTFDYLKQLDNLPYLEWVFRETLRLHPVAGPAISRSTRVPVQLGEYYLPANLNIVFDFLSIHKNPSIWGSEPIDEFVPERHATRTKKVTADLLSFGVGPRRCIGARVGQIGTKIAVIATLSKFKITLGPKPLIVRQGAALTPKKVVLALTKRQL
jgi:hypothetical protein